METSITLVFLRCDKEPLFTRIKFQYNRLLIRIHICRVKLKLESLSATESWKCKSQAGDVNCTRRKFNSWQSPNVLRRPHNYSKLMYGHTYKLVSKYLKLTVYLISLWGFFLSVSYPTRTKNKMVTRSSFHTSKLFSAIFSFTVSCCSSPALASKFISIVPDNDERKMAF